MIFLAVDAGSRILPHTHTQEPKTQSHTHIHTHPHTHTHTHTPTHTHTYTHTQEPKTQSLTHQNIHTHPNIHLFAHKHKHKNTHTHLLASTHTQILAHALLHTVTHSKNINDLGPNLRILTNHSGKMHASVSITKQSIGVKNDPLLPQHCLRSKRLNHGGMRPIESQLDHYVLEASCAERTGSVHADHLKVLRRNLEK